jgi:protein gp37
MGETSAIDWTDATWNPWRGCHKVSTGCLNCYMFRDQARYGKDPSTVVRAAKQTFELPLRLAAGTKVFTCSWSDFFIEEADAWRSEAWDIIRLCPDLTFQILTKRPDRIMQCLPSDWGTGYPNVWLVVSCEHQQAATERVPILIDIPCAVRGVSAGPLIGRIDLLDVDGEVSQAMSERNPRTLAFPADVIDWVAIECESGPKPRGWDTYEDNARLLIEQCESAGVGCFHKQMPINGRVSHNPAEWPEWARVRQWPATE